MAGIINYLIGAALMISILFILKQKYRGQPHMKISGLSLKTITAILYIGIAIDAILMAAILAGWIKY